ncbi:hypothetical protein THIOM_003059 [Candidatus Thiomargarita nelsonii]|uniref:Uncharacterized protein n=1 Tax=Candidatus Thiomargarita nelsonii TaxID=1003181 RepID=A0A176RZQ7_9GAMM|nr:hypothetical protein THIOM_003059 [Candidatus Thiomargarita nelsonii]
MICILTLTAVFTTKSWMVTSWCSSSRTMVNILAPGGWMLKLFSTATGTFGFSTWNSEIVWFCMNPPSASKTKMERMDCKLPLMSRISTMNWQFCSVMVPLG